MKPKFSVIICTYNGGKLIQECLSSILNQSEKSIELFCVDGGSTDGTIEYITKLKKEDSRITLINNLRKLPEGKGNGKWQGYLKSRGSIIGFIDQDNILQSKNILKEAYSILNKEKEILGVLAGLTNDKKDEPLVRYVSLVGTDSFMAYRSADFIRNISKSSKRIVDGAEYELFTLNKEPLTITGGNCFFYRKSDLSKIGGYTQDIFVVQKLLNAGKNTIAVIPSATKHFAETSLTKLAFKKLKWGKTYFNRRKEESFNYFPATFKEASPFFVNFLFNILIIPNFYYSFKLFRKSKDSISFLFPVQAFITTLAYIIGFIVSKIS